MSSVMKVLVQKKKVDMSSQTCNYCKETGHRIHKMDEFGSYVQGPDGTRIVVCPVLLRKDQVKTVRNCSVEQAFPALPGSTGPVSDYTVAVAKGLDGAIQDLKKSNWLKRKAEKEEAKNAWIDRYFKRMETKYGSLWHWLVEKTADDNEHAAYRRREEDQYVDQMRDEYGPAWFWAVEGTSDETSYAHRFREEERSYIERMTEKYGDRWYDMVRNTDNDNECASWYRNKAEQEEIERERRDEMVWEQVHECWERESEQKSADRKVKRSKMTSEEKERDDEECEDDLDYEMFNEMSRR